jgi:thiamine transport system ATP-binding protein
MSGSFDSFLWLNSNMANGLQIEQIHKSFGSTHALKGVDLAFNEGEIVAVLGPSGSGKSTLLAVIAGLEAPDAGDIYWKGERLTGIPPHRRGFGLMFQDFALFPHMNAFDNVSYGLRVSGKSKAEIRQQTSKMLDLVGLGGFENRDVNTLSGGEQQRIALARSLAPHPRLLMLDEPLGALDRNLRERLISDLRLILRRMEQTALYVTHDQEEAFTLADRIVLINEGKVEQIGPPQLLYQQPASLYVAKFLGLTNLLPGHIFKDEEGYQIKTEIGKLALSEQHREGPATILIRPDSMHLEEISPHFLEGWLRDIAFRGSFSRASVEINGVFLNFDLLSREKLPNTNDCLRLFYRPDQAFQIFNSSK